MKTINSSLTVKNEVDVRGHAILELIKQYITFPSAFYGFKSIGANPGMQFPVLFVEPKSQIPDMATTAKYRIKLTYAIYWFVRENAAEDAVAISSFIGEALIKLFSNNALSDLQSANPPSNKFKQYSTFWLDSEMQEIRWSVNYLDPDVHGARYERAGRMMFQIEDIILK